MQINFLKVFQYLRSMNIRIWFSLIPIIVFALLFCSCSMQIRPKPEASIKIAKNPRPIDFSKKLICKLKYLQEMTYSENNIQLEGPITQDFGEVKNQFEFQPNGNVLIWMDFNGEENKIGEELPPDYGLVIANDISKIIVIDCTDEISLFHYQPCFIHTFFKDTGVYTYYKVNSIMVGLTPRGTMSMGYCT